MSESSKDYAAMQAELEQAEWQFVESSPYTDYFVQVIAPNGFSMIYNADFETSAKQCYESAVGQAYEHFLREKRYTEMETLLQELSNYAEDTSTDGYGNILAMYARMAKELLGD